ncbi:SpoIID/LytB domain-containing protein [Synechococcus sp. MU1642]|uniref:SpoIID/LytB domain-containing protein n=1 Tax=Synechococcus sp. MU1642 TaxID=2508348 RepID=UPI001CF83871|nr:SpoIID/LytB domain-containing protein [Synechococcus sp. MU1642]MCB4407984.1 SpoIID/LytB domain-containing protein [Synechococcus sp. MU1642]
MIRLLTLTLLLCMGLGCRAREQVDALQPAVVEPAQRVTHLAVNEPPPVEGHEPVLWVALEDHLGATATAAPLNLRAFAGSLSLRDATGELGSGSGFVITWRNVTLARPLKLARRIAGPYSSFESADRVASRWGALGVAAEVAHPKEWEVWAPEGSPVPEGLAVRDWQGTLTNTVEPVLQTPEGGRPLQEYVLIKASDGLLWAGGRFEGPFRLQRDAYGSWTLVEQVPVERYLEGVVPHEIGAGSPMAALQAQTVLARTWALANSHRFSIDGYHLCSDTQCQVYSDPRHAGAAVREAIAGTQGKLLSLNNQPISAVYHATNGGVMAAGPEAWAMQPTIYLRPKPDGDARWSNSHPLPLQQRQAVLALLADRSGAYGAQHPRFRWSRTLSGPGLRQALGAAAGPLVSPLQLQVLERGASGRVLALQISGSGDAAPVVLKLDAIRRTLRTLPSTLFVVEPQGPERWLVVGGGFGHGAGLSQAGAIDLAWRGWPVERILSHYYPGTVYSQLSTPAQPP